MRLVALQVTDPARFWDEVTAGWSRGEAVLPLDPRLPPCATEETLGRMRPSAVIDDTGTHDLQGDAPVPEGTAVVLLTSGSTGVPKGVVLSRAALDASISATHGFLGASIGERWLCCLPPHHVAGFLSLARGDALGTATEIHDRFDPERVAASDSDYVSLVPTMLKRLLDQELDLTGFAAILLGGAAIPEGLIERAAAAGARVVRTYGMTETCGGVVYDGAPLPGVDIRVTEDGIIEVSSPTLMSGYREIPHLTDEVLKDGWFTTRDTGSWDGTILKVLGRADDMIVTGGEKVAPSAVETRLAAHPAVTDVAVIGVPDPEWGSAVTAFVVLAPGSMPPDLAQWRAFVRQSLPHAAAPRSVHVVTSIPRSPTGKPDRVALSAWAK